MTRRSISHLTCALAALALGGPAIAGPALPVRLAPDRVEGTLVAAACFVRGDRTSACRQRALAGGLPGGVLEGGHFTLLLVDGRVLARSCAANAIGRIRAAGLLHRRGAALSLARLEQDCGQGWAAVDVPHAGTVVEGAAGGDE